MPAVHADVWLACACARLLNVPLLLPLCTMVTQGLCMTWTQLWMLTTLMMSSWARASAAHATSCTTRLPVGWHLTVSLTSKPTAHHCLPGTRTRSEPLGSSSIGQAKSAYLVWLPVHTAVQYSSTGLAVLGPSKACVEAMPHMCWQHCMLLKQSRHNSVLAVMLMQVCSKAANRCQPSSAAASITSQVR